MYIHCIFFIIKNLKTWLNTVVQMMFACVCVCVCVCVMCIYMYMCVHMMCVYMTCIYMYVYVYVYTCTYVCTGVSSTHWVGSPCDMCLFMWCVIWYMWYNYVIYVCTGTLYVYICMYICMCVYRCFQLMGRGLPVGRTWALSSIAPLADRNSPTLASISPRWGGDKEQFYQ